jgi:ferric-dicitrate binding protein FerR (iron transport regulator)
MNCGGIAELITRCATGNSSPEDESSLRKHLVACPACSADYQRACRVWNLMGELRPLRSSRPVPQVARPRRWIVPAAAAAALLAVGLGLALRPSTPPASPEVARPQIQPEITPAVSVREETRDEAEQNRVEQLLTSVEEEKKTAPAPKPEPRNVSEPPKPVVRTPEPPRPQPLPEPKPVVVPAPEPRPAPPAPKPQETRTIVASLDRVEGGVFVVDAGVRNAARAGQDIAAGQSLETSGAGSQAVLEFPDGSRLALGADSVLGQVSERKAGMQIHVSQGVVAAQIGRQPADEPLVFVTPHAEARVLGTRLTLTVLPASTRVEVREGRVRVVRRADHASVDLTADHFALVAKGSSLVSRSIAGPRIVVREGFDRKWGPAWISGGDGLRATGESGVLAIKVPRRREADLAPSTGGTDPAKQALDSALRNAARADQLRSAWLETRQSFAPTNEAPVRIRVRAWQSHEDADRGSFLAVNRGQGFLLERRGDLLRLLGEGGAVLWKNEAAAAQEWETLELWISKDHLAVRRNGLTVYSAASPLKGRALTFSVGASAKAELAQDEEVRFDDIELAWVSKGDFEEIRR